MDSVEQQVNKNKNLVPAVFNALEQQYTRKLLRIHEDDLLQEGMIALWTAAQTYNEEQGCAFSTYAYTVIINRMRGYIANEYKLRYKHRPEFISIYAPIPEQQDLVIGDLLRAPELPEDVTWILNHPKLKNNHKELLSLIYAGYTQQEIADMRGVTRQSINKTLHTIKQRIEKYKEYNQR